MNTTNRRKCRYFSEIREFEHSTRKVLREPVEMVRGPRETGNVAILKEDRPRVMNGEGGRHYRIPEDELMLD